MVPDVLVRYLEKCMICFLNQATGYPLAYIAAKLALGSSLAQLRNSVTGSRQNMMLVFLIPELLIPVLFIGVLNRD
jgi:inner membrane protein involved in colicin E2 resistance